MINFKKTRIGAPKTSRLAEKLFLGFLVGMFFMGLGLHWGDNNDPNPQYENAAKAYSATKSQLDFEQCQADKKYAQSVLTLVAHGTMPKDDVSLDDMATKSTKNCDQLVAFQ